MPNQPTGRKAPAASPRDPDGALRAELGTTIRRLRKDRGMTLVQLARQAELSHPFLSQLERGLTRPSMPSLHRIARALGTTQQGLLAAASQDNPEGGTTPIRVVREDQGLTVAHDGGFARMLDTSHLGIHAVEYRGIPLAFQDFYFDHPGDEFLYVVSGEVEVNLETPQGPLLHHLRPGDSLSYPGGTPHRWRALGDGDRVRVLALQNAAGPAAGPAVPEGPR